MIVNISTGLLEKKKNKKNHVEVFTNYNDAHNFAKIYNVKVRTIDNQDYERLLNKREEGKKIGVTLDTGLDEDDIYEELNEKIDQIEIKRPKNIIEEEVKINEVRVQKN